MMTADHYTLIWSILMKYKNTGITFLGLHNKLKKAHNIKLDECFSEPMAEAGYLISEENGLLFPCRDRDENWIDYGIPKLWEDG